MDLCKVHATGIWVCIWEKYGGARSVSPQRRGRSCCSSGVGRKYYQGGVDVKAGTIWEDTLVIPQQESDYDTVYTGMIWGQGRTMNFYSLPTLYFDYSEHLWDLLPGVCYF